MPFDPEFDGVYEELIKAPLVAAGFEVRRADDVSDRRNVLGDVVTGIADADLVIADLTTGNANVFYELGLAHALGVPTILIAQQAGAEEIPFDLSQYRTEFYDTQFQRAPELADTLQKLGRSLVDRELRFSSPIADFLPGAHAPTIASERAHENSSRSDQTTQPSRPDSVGVETTHDAGAASQGEDDRGLLDFVEDFNQAAEEFGVAASPLGVATETMGARVAEIERRTAAVDQTAPGSQAQTKRLLKDVPFAVELRWRSPV